MTITISNKRFLYVIPASMAVSLMIFMNMNIIKYFPGIIPVRETWLVIMAIVLVYLSCVMLIDKNRISSLEKYMLVLVFMPVYLAINAYAEFHQPLYYGLLVGRESVLIATSLLMIYMYKRRMIDLKDIESSLVYVAWFTLAIYIMLIVFFDPSRFIGQPGFVGGQAIGRLSFTFQQGILVYGYLYYLSRALIRKSTRDFVLSLFFIGFIINTMERGLILATLFASIYLLIRVYSITRIVEWSPVWSILMATSIIPLYMVFSNYVDPILTHIYHALSVMITGQPSGDPSADARIAEVGMVMPYISDSPFLGNGMLSHRWHGGYAGHLGKLAPTDIGLAGAVFVYGLVGIALYLGQIYYFYKYSFHKRGHEMDPLVLASSSFLVYYFIHSISTGMIVFKPHIGLLFITILFLHHRNMTVGSNHLERSR